jgi:hypothetical protein
MQSIFQTNPLIKGPEKNYRRRASGVLKLPAISTTVKGIPEIVQDEVSDILVSRRRKNLAEA